MCGYKVEVYVSDDDKIWKLFLAVLAYKSKKLTGLGAVVFLAITPTRERVHARHQPWHRRNHYAMYVLGAETGPQRQY